MKNNIIFRSFNDTDYKTIVDWWNWWWGDKGAIERKYLPHNDYCFIISKGDTCIASGFLFVDKHSPVGYLTYVISNPDYKQKDRRSIIEELILRIEKHAKSKGIEFIFTVCGNIHMENIHNKLGWTIDKTAPAYETFKYI